MKSRASFSWALAVLVCVLIPSATIADTADLLGYGDTIAGSLDAVGEIDVHTFVGGVGDIVLLRLGETTSSLEPVLTLTGPTSEYYHDSANALAEITTAPLDHNGVYTITVSDNDHNDTGGYSLHIQRINGPAGAVSLDFGTTQSGSLPTAATTVAYTLSGDAGDRVLLRMAEEVTNSYLSPRLRVYQTDGTLIADVSGGYATELNTLELPATATYTVLALDNVGVYTGGFYLHCQRMNDPVGALGIAYGQTVTGNLSMRSEADIFRFVGSDYDLLLARVGEVTTSLEAVLRLYGADGVQITEDSGNGLSELPLTALPGSEMYTLLIADDPGLDTGEYTLHIQRINVPAGAVSLDFGTTQSGSVPMAASTVAYTLSGDAGDQVLLRMAEEVTNSYLGPRLRVYQTDGTLVADVSGGYSTELNTLELPATATYTVLALDNAGIYTGGYYLHCQRMNDPVGALGIAYGQTVTGNLSMRSEADIFRFVGSDYDLLLARVGEVTTSLETVLRLYGADGVQITEGSGNSLSELPLTALPGSEMYTLLITDDPGLDTGDYTLHIQRINVPAGAVSLDFGTTQSGSVPMAASTVAYTLSGDAGDRVLLRMAEEVTNSYLGPRLRVYQTDGTLVADIYGGYVAELNTLELPATATYTVLALDNAGIYTGGYFLHCRRMNDPVGSVPISYGQTLAGDLTYRSETDVYTLTATASDLLLARLGETTTSLESELRLYGADGVQIAEAAGNGLSELPLTALPSSETYTLLVLDDPGLDTGGYSLHIQRINDPVGATTLDFGTTQSGSLPTAATTVAYTLSGDLGDQVLLRMAEEVTNSYLAPSLRVYQADGTLVADVYGGYVAELNTLQLPATATYTVLALDNAGIYTGGYYLHCQRTNDPVGAVSLNYGDTHPGELLLRAEAHAYTFTAASNDTVLARMSEITTSLEPLIRIYGPDGVQIAADTGSAEAEISGERLTTEGVYTVLAMDDPGLDTGEYLLTVIGGAPVSAVHDPDGWEVPVAALALHDCSPNPFNPATTVRFDLPTAAEVRLVVYSLSGRRLTTLVNGIMPAGRHGVVWRGIDDRGRQAASGIYLIRLQVAGKQFVTKTTLLK